MWMYCFPSADPKRNWRRWCTQRASIFLLGRSIFFLNWVLPFCHVWNEMLMCVAGCMVSIYFPLHCFISYRLSSFFYLVELTISLSDAIFDNFLARIREAYWKVNSEGPSLCCVIQYSLSTTDITAAWYWWAIQRPIIDNKTESWNTQLFYRERRVGNYWCTDMEAMPNLPTSPHRTRRWKGWATTGHLWRESSRVPWERVRVPNVGGITCTGVQKWKHASLFFIMGRGSYVPMIMSIRIPVGW